MILDGVFLHHLVNELKDDILNKRVHKVTLIDGNTFLLSLQGRIDLYISLNSDICHLRITKNDHTSTNKTPQIYTILKRHLVSSIIKDIKQIENDRIVRIVLEASDDLGYKYEVNLILEFFGRNANLFLTNGDDIIIDCLKRSFVLEDNDKRILIPKMKYSAPIDDRINPYKTDEILDSYNYQGVSNLVYTEIIYQNDLNIIKQIPKPQITKKNNKTFFSSIPLEHLNGEVEDYSTLSELLEEYYTNLLKTSIQNHEQKLIENYLKREKKKVEKKIIKQHQDKKKAIKNLDLEKIGNLLSANLHKVGKHDNRVVVEDFYNNNEEVIIELDPKISPAHNLDNIFKRYKKAKRSISTIDSIIEESNKELEYLELIENQLEIATHHELKEIVEELNLVKAKPKKQRKDKPQLETYILDDNSIIWVGKNNIQNNYLTNKFANRNDYFFHVKDIPGSHTILRCNELTENNIRLAAQIAAYYSKARNSSNVPVDYTLVKYVKRVPKTKGSFVTYTNFKTTYVTPDIDYINKNTKKGPS